MKKIVKTTLFRLIKIYLFPLFLSLKIMPDKLYYFITIIFNMLENVYINKYVLLFRHIDLIRKPLPVFNFNDVGIVVQGPFFEDNNFTIYMLERYRKIYPFAPIILSTWKNEVSDADKILLKNLKIELIENKQPKFAKGHLNHQLLSSYQGMVMLKEKYNCTYALKTRTDQIFLKPNFIKFLIDLEKCFAPKNVNVLSRLIFLDLSYKFVPFHLCDFMCFGNVEDLINLYNIECSEVYTEADQKVIDERVRISDFELLDFHDKKIDVDKESIVMANGTVPEMFIVKNYFNKYVEKIDEKNILRQYWKFLKECAIIVNADALKFYWPKYIFKRYIIEDSSIREFGDLDFSAWLSIITEDGENDA